MFKDRFDAGKKLAQALQHYKNRDSVILAVPRGGVEIGYVVAKALDLPLEVVLSKKIGHPSHSEYAIGAVSMEGSVVTKPHDVSEEYIQRETLRLQGMLRDRFKKYYGDRKPVSLEDKIVIVVDDGIATGETLRSTIQLIRHHHPRWLVVAIPVSPPDSLLQLKNTEGVDEVVCLLVPKDFYAVGQFYKNFEQVEDHEVIRMLHELWYPKSRGEKPLVM